MAKIFPLNILQQVALWVFVELLITAEAFLLDRRNLHPKCGRLSFPSQEDRLRHRSKKNDESELAGPILPSLDPCSPSACDLVMGDLGLGETEYEKLVNLSFLVPQWNERVNLVSRKDCSPETVFARHILPSVSGCSSKISNNPLAAAKTVVDVGTGGGFPGLPLAIAYPDTEFLLLDSVGKKLSAVEEMSKELELNNVQIHHGRAEDLRGFQFDVATGRSVSALPKFCAWMHRLLKEKTGQLMYWIGGDVEEEVLAQSSDRIDSILPSLDSDKRILIFSQESVRFVAQQSGLLVGTKNDNVKKSLSKQKAKNNSRSAAGKKIQKSKGAWQRSDPNRRRERGLDDFQRYSSDSSTY